MGSTKYVQGLYDSIVKMMSSKLYVLSIIINNKYFGTNTWALNKQCLKKVWNIAFSWSSDF